MKTFREFFLKESQEHLDSDDFEDLTEKKKQFIGNADGFSWAVKLDGINPEFPKEPFGRQIDGLRRSRVFVKEPDTKSYHVGAKGKSTLAAVRAWVKETKPSEFYARWKSDSSIYKDDSVEIFYKP